MITLDGYLDVRHYQVRYYQDGPHTFSSTQFNLEGNVVAKIKAMQAKIADDDLADDGKETDLHVTVKYGIHTQDVEDVEEIVRGFGPVEITLGKSSIFPAKEATAQRGGDQHDVVKIDVESKDLVRLNKLICDKLECTDTHPVYKPHVTLAYVKAGKGKEYADDDSVDGMEITFDTMVFSPAEGDKSSIKCYGHLSRDVSNLIVQTATQGMAKGNKKATKRWADEVKRRIALGNMFIDYDDQHYMVDASGHLHKEKGSAEGGQFTGQGGGGGGAAKSGGDAKTKIAALEAKIKVTKDPAARMDLKNEIEDLQDEAETKNTPEQSPAKPADKPQEADGLKGLQDQLRKAGVDPAAHTATWNNPNPLDYGKDALPPETETALQSGIADAVAKQKASNPFQRLDIKQLYDKFGNGKVTPHQFKSVLARMSLEKKVRLGPYTQALPTHEAPEFLMPFGREYKSFVEQYGESQYEDKFITIGGHAEGGKQHVGGTVVKIGADGKMLAGVPKEMVGTPISKAKEGFDKVKKEDAPAAPAAPDKTPFVTPEGKLHPKGGPMAARAGSGPMAPAPKTSLVTRDGKLAPPAATPEKPASQEQAGNPDAKPAPVKKKFEKYDRAKDRTGSTLYKIVSRMGGISRESAMAHDLGALLEGNLSGLFPRKGGQDLETLSERLHSEGHINIPGYHADDPESKGAHKSVSAEAKRTANDPSEHLLGQLEKGGVSLLANVDNEYEKSYKRYMKESEDVRKAVLEQSAIEEALRSGEEDGVSEEEKGDAWEGSAGAPEPQEDEWAVKEEGSIPFEDSNGLVISDVRTSRHDDMMALLKVMVNRDAETKKTNDALVKLIRFVMKPKKRVLRRQSNGNVTIEDVTGKKDES